MNKHTVTKVRNISKSAAAFIIIMITVFFGVGFTNIANTNDGEPFVSLSGQNYSQIAPMSSNWTSCDDGSTDFLPIDIRSYRLNSGSGYHINASRRVTNATHPLRQPFINLSVQAESQFPRQENEDGRTGAFVERGTFSNRQAFGVSGSSFYIGLNYNFNRRTNFTNHETVPRGTRSPLEFSSDGATHVNGDFVGTIRYGAIVIGKSETGLANSYRMQTLQGDTLDNIRTTDLTTNFAPENFSSENDPLRFYVPRGHDVNQGIFIRILFAYQLSLHIHGQLMIFLYGLSELILTRFILICWKLPSSLSCRIVV